MMSKKVVIFIMKIVIDIFLVILGVTLIVFGLRVTNPIENFSTSFISGIIMLVLGGIFILVGGFIIYFAIESAKLAIKDEDEYNDENNKEAAVKEYNHKSDVAVLDNMNNPQNPQTAETYLHSIQEINDRITGDNISLKIDLINQKCSKIFSYINDPDKSVGVDRFLSYYLPVTLKLIQQYHDLQQSELDTPRIIGSMNEIEKAIEDLIPSFDALLESMFLNQTLDISAEITVLKNRLKADGLVESEFVMDALES